MAFCFLIELKSPQLNSSEAANILLLLMNKYSLLYFLKVLGSITRDLTPEKVFNTLQAISVSSSDSIVHFILEEGKVNGKVKVIGFSNVPVNLPFTLSFPFFSHLSVPKSLMVKIGGTVFSFEKSVIFPAAIASSVNFGLASKSANSEHPPT
jgi:hypothetical protein